VCCALLLPRLPSTLHIRDALWAPLLRTCAANVSGFPADSVVLSVWVRFGIIYMTASDDNGPFQGEAGIVTYSTAASSKSFRLAVHVTFRSSYTTSTLLFSAGGVDYPSSEVVPSNGTDLRWRHIAVLWNVGGSRVAQMFLDGVLIHSVFASATTFPSTGRVFIGQDRFATIAAGDQTYFGASISQVWRDSGPAHVSRSTAISSRWQCVECLVCVCAPARVCWLCVVCV
jgi:hypothetical protein